MTHTYRKPLPPEHYTWGKPRYGKWYKRQYHRAMRRVAKGTGKTKAVARWASECNWKGT